MKYRTEKHRIGYVELTYFLIGALLLLLLGTIVKGQSTADTRKSVRAHTEMQQSLYRDYRGVRLGMTATEARAKLGEPVMKSNEQDYYVFSQNETAQIVYDAFQKVVTISTDYTDGIGAPDYRAVVGAGALLQKPDGSLFRMVQYDSEGVWVTYYKSATVVPIVTVTLQLIKK